MLVFDNTSAAWLAQDLANNQTWFFNISDSTQTLLRQVTHKAFDPNRSLFEYSKDDFDFGPAIEIITAAAQEALHGCGLTLVRGLPRHGMTEKEFQLMVWAIGLHLGVARPQGGATHYISEVRNTGMDYRSAGGRGYNSNAALDFHCDGCDLVALACYNKAKKGGQSLISSSITAWRSLLMERPNLAEIAQQNFYFSRNQEEAPDEPPYYAQPLFDCENGCFFGKWNRNRVRTAQEIRGVPKLTQTQIECIDLLDNILRRPDTMWKMWLEPGDLQFINNHVILHSRSSFEDHLLPEHQRLLFRLWIAPPNSVKLPKSWAAFYGSTAPGTVRGGIRGHNHNESCRAFERRQAKEMAMPPPLSDKYAEVPG